MPRTWIKHEVKRNEVADGLDIVAGWVRRNRETALGLAGALLVAIVFGAYFVVRMIDVRKDAWEKLARAESYLYVNQADQTLKELKDLQTQSPSAPASQFGSLLSGDVLYRQGKHKEAADSYRAFLDSGAQPGLAPVALAGLAAAQEAAGQLAEAAATYRRFL